ncbi:MAG: C10 family peptidase [Bacteroidaceae bacterium]|nr:C10 family peptidase [Bacteroidaceae bacterium]
MKRFTLSFLILCLALVAWAEPIGRQAARYTAQSYMLAKGKTIDRLPVPLPRREVHRGSVKDSLSTEGDWDEAFYVFNAGNDAGYVIVSGDDRVEPILGYVEQGSFDPENIPDNMRSWLQGYADEIKYVIDNDIQPNSPILRKRNKVKGTRHSVPEILTSRWNQGLPYNLTISKYYKEDGTLGRPAAGCIATAWAQVINFHKFPEKIKVEIPAYTKTYTLSDGTKKTVTFPAVPRNSVIDWENMRDTYSCSEDHAHTAADTAVANLIRYCGQAVKMSYGKTSGANWKAPDVIKYFGFDDSGHRVGRDECSIDEWFDLIYNEVAAGYPVPFSGSKISGGHAFVIDGFDGENLFHVNWGWGGGSNGWFLIGVLNSGDNSGIGAASGSGGYARGQAAVIGLRRPDNVKADTYLSIDDIAVSGTSVKATFTNNTGETGSYHTAIVKQEDDGSLSVVGTKLSISGMTNDAYQTKTFQIKGKLPEGTYRLSPASKTTRSDVWRAKYNMRDQYIEAVVDAEGVPVMRIVDPVIDIAVDTVVFAGLRIVNQEQELKVTFRNNGDEFYRDVHLFASKTQSKVYTENLARVAVRKGEKAEFSFYFTPSETGTYNLWFCTEKDGSGQIGQGTMEVVEEADAVKANLAVTYSVTNGANNIAYGKRLVGKASIKNNAREDFHGNIKLQIWKQKVGSNSATSGSSSMYYVDVPAGRTASVDFNFENLSEGYYYRFKAFYVNQEGNLSGGGIWDWKCEMQGGVLTWKEDGTVAGKAATGSVTTLSTACGSYADTSIKITRMTPNKNPNTIYAFASGMDVPTKLEASNVVSGKHAGRISLVSDQPYYVPVSFDADSASFTYLFPETETGIVWHAFTMPFGVDSVFVDDIPVSLDDTLKHFWIYEFAAQSDNGEVIFAPATVLRAETPYIIAGDSWMAGRSVTFRSLAVPFYKTGSGKMVVTSSDYQFRGSTLVSKVKDCYVLNAEGTAFEYVTTNMTLPALSSYFTTNLPEDVRPSSIILPVIAESTDGIRDIEHSPLNIPHSTGAVYNLAGQRIGNSQLPKGLYIINGRKIIK